jgi:hypothetical protein
MQTNVKVRPRDKQNEGPKPTLFRTSEEVSDAVYLSFNGLAHRQRLADGTSVFSSRMIRRESFTREELMELESLINSEGQDSITGQVLSSEVTLPWIGESLRPSGKTTAAAA